MFHFTMFNELDTDFTQIRKFTHLGVLGWVKSASNPVNIVRVGVLRHHATTEGGCEILGQCLGFACLFVCPQDALTARRLTCELRPLVCKNATNPDVFLKKRNVDFLRISTVDCPEIAGTASCGAVLLVLPGHIPRKIRLRALRVYEIC